MKELSCDDVLMAQMAVADGEAPELSQELFEAHVASCANCRQDLAEMQSLDLVLAQQMLAESSVDLWPPVENRIAKRSLGWKPFALIGLLLVVYKLLELLPARDLGLVFKLVPLVIFTLLFVFIRENPFRINTELVLER